jgi:dTDP-4-amino-4,6-dideoxygalactose transaminase
MNIPLFKVLMSPNAGELVANVLNSGYIGQGQKVEEFEKVLATHFNNSKVLTVNSGTTALSLAVHALGLGGNDEILTTPLTCTATNWAILANKVKLKWVDIDQNTANFDLVDLERKITPNTKAIMVVHWGGYPVDLDKLNCIVERAYDRFNGYKTGNKIAIIEDCAHGFGSFYKGKHVGTNGNWGAFSFQAIKHLTCGDGGALIAPDHKQYLRLKLLRWYGIDRNENRKDFRCESNIYEFGFKGHMNDINATIGLANYDLALNGINKNILNAKFYRDKLQNVDGIELLHEEHGFDSSYWIFTIKCDRRDDFIRKMAEHGIVCSRVHERNDKHFCVSEFKAALPSLDEFIQKMVCIPVGWWVNDEDRQYIVDKIKTGW